MGHRLSKLRWSAGHTQKSAADALGMTISVVQRIEAKGTTKLSTLRRLTTLYGADLSQVFTPARAEEIAEILKAPTWREKKATASAAGTNAVTG